MAQLINEAKRMQRLAGIITEAEATAPKWETVGPDDSGPYHGVWYKTSIPEDKIIQALGIKEDDIQISGEAMQEDPTMWFVTLKINVNALPEDKKANYKQTVRNIIKPQEEKATEPEPDVPVKKVSGIIDKIKSIFGKKQNESQLNEEEVKVGETYTYNHPKAGPVKVKALGKSSYGDEYFTVEALEEKGEVKKGNQYNAEIKNLKAIQAESINIESTVNEALRKFRKK